MHTFTPFQKIPRLFKNVSCSEKLDGTNGAVAVYPTEDGGLEIAAQSRKRIITPEADNHGFAAWVYEHKDALIEVLGPGIHFGEWWGHGINRGYGLQKGDKRFSLFNIKRWGHFADPEQQPDIPGLGVVPNLGTGTFNDSYILDVYDRLMEEGSRAAPGYDNPEGIVAYHSAAGCLFKVTDPYRGDPSKGARLEAVAE